MTTAWRLTQSSVALAALAAGCGDSLPPILCDGGRCGVQTSTRKTFQAGFNRKLDMLFVVDDTAAIAPYTDAIATGLAQIAERQSDPGAPTSVHAGFIRAGGCDATTRGAACGVVAPEQFLRSEWCNTATNFSGTFADALTCLGALGAASCAPAQPLATAVQLLAGPARAGWEGFLRPDAYLAIVFITAEDDASGQPLTPVVELAQIVKGLRPDPSQVIVSAIGPGGCVAGDEPGPRLLEFVNQFGANGLYLPLCSAQYSAALDRAFMQINWSLQPPCVQNVRDTDLDAPGLQAACTVEDRSRGPDGSLTTSSLPSCDESQPPCWRMLPGGGVNCTGYVFEIVRADDWCVEAGTNATLECLGCADANDPTCAPIR
jgi:hypothetical protein